MDNIAPDVATIELVVVVSLRNLVPQSLSNFGKEKKLFKIVLYGNVDGA